MAGNIEFEPGKNCRSPIACNFRKECLVAKALREAIGKGNKEYLEALKDDCCPCEHPDANLAKEEADSLINSQPSSGKIDKDEKNMAFPHRD